jgi:single-strand DNA-binding protein
MARSLNRVELIGNLTRDPELRYTPQGTAVCTLGIATNRSWQTENGEKKEDVEFHRVIAWNKLAELCSQLLTKGRKVYVEGRLQTRSWTAQDGAQKSLTEIVINDMLILDSKRSADVSDGVDEAPMEAPSQEDAPVKSTKKKPSTPVEDEINPDDIPF